MGDAIHYVHGQGFVHRDLKPGNIIMDLENHPNIIDFGLSKCERDEDMMAIERYRAARDLIRRNRISEYPSILGTPAYASPEQASGDAFHASPRSDIYSLGIIFYELLCGRRPFNGTGRALVRQILTGRPHRPSRHRSKIPTELDAICLMAIARRVEDRYETAADFAEDCRNAVAGKPVTAKVPRWTFWR
jgi:serine/threonine-protein kinase